MKRGRRLNLLLVSFISVLSMTAQVTNPILQKVEIPTDTIIDVPQVPPTPDGVPVGSKVPPKKILPDSLISFQDEGIKRLCLRDTYIDKNGDGQISINEASQVTTLSFMSFKSFICVINSYDDLKYFPKLAYLHAGSSRADTLDLSKNPDLKVLDVSDCRALTTIILAKGCNPNITMTRSLNKEEEPIVLHKE